RKARMPPCYAMARGASTAIEQAEGALQHLGQMRGGAQQRLLAKADPAPGGDLGIGHDLALEGLGAEDLQAELPAAAEPQLGQRPQGMDAEAELLPQFAGGALLGRLARLEPPARQA